MKMFAWSLLALAATISIADARIGDRWRERRATHLQHRLGRLQSRMGVSYQIVPVQAMPAAEGWSTQVQQSGEGAGVGLLTFRVGRSAASC